MIQTLFRWPGSGRRKLIRVLAVLTWLVALVGTGYVAFDNVRCVVFFGPLLGCAALVQLIWASVTRYRSMIFLSIYHLAVCGLCVGLVTVFKMGPRDAQVPFTWLSAVYTTLTLPLTLFAVLNPPVSHTPGVCDRCGYLLKGLTTPRCPECGTPIEPGEIVPATSA